MILKTALLCCALCSGGGPQSQSDTVAVAEDTLEASVPIRTLSGDASASAKVDASTPVIHGQQSEGSGRLALQLKWFDFLIVLVPVLGTIAGGIIGSRKAKVATERPRGFWGTPLAIGSLLLLVMSIAFLGSRRATVPYTGPDQAVVGGWATESIRGDVADMREEIEEAATALSAIRDQTIADIRSAAEQSRGELATLDRELTASSARLDSVRARTEALARHLGESDVPGSTESFLLSSTADLQLQISGLERELLLMGDRLADVEQGFRTVTGLLSQ